MIRILAVDDMSRWRNYHSDALNVILKGIDYELTLKSCASEAYEHIQQAQPYDLIITDLQMETSYEPEHAGEWLVRNIKELPAYKTTPIIIASASYDIRFIAEKHGTDYISKSTIIHNPLTYELKIKEALHI